MEQFLFYLLALAAVAFALLVITCKNPVNSAISLVMTFVCLAAFYVMLSAPFMAAVQIMVYAGAIIVLIVFVIMLLNLGEESFLPTRHAVGGALGVGGVLVFVLGYLFFNSRVTGAVGELTPAAILAEGHTELIGKTLFTDFLLPFEITSLLLLAAIIGAVVLAKRNL